MATGYPYNTLTVGQKVHIGQFRGYAAGIPQHTIELIDGDQAVLAGPNGHRQIVKLDNLWSPTVSQSDGWFTVADRPGFAYFIHWDHTTGGPVYRWGIQFSNGEIEAFPQPFGLNHSLRPFRWEDFKPVKLTTQALR